MRALRALWIRAVFILVCAAPGPKTDTQPMKVRVVLLGIHPNERGAIPMTPECMSLDVLEGCLHALQDQLDLVRPDAQQTFMRGTLGRA